MDAAKLGFLRFDLGFPIISLTDNNRAGLSAARAANERRIGREVGADRFTGFDWRLLEAADGRRWWMTGSVAATPHRQGRLGITALAAAF